MHTSSLSIRTLVLKGYERSGKKQSQQHTPNPRSSSHHIAIIPNSQGSQCQCQCQVFQNHVCISPFSSNSQSANQSTLLKPPDPSRPIQLLHLHPHSHTTSIRNESKPSPSAQYSSSEPSTRQPHIKRSEEGT
jgi:hypothetical protein